MNENKSERDLKALPPPVEKVVVIKKSKIRKFMKLKQKEKMREIVLKEQEEIH